MMKTLLKTYLILMFATSASNAGSENDSIISGFQIEACNFAVESSSSDNLTSVADCINTSFQNEYTSIEMAVAEDVSK